MRFPIALFTVPLLIAAACSGQSKQNIVQTGSVDAHGANWIPPTSTFASPPSSAATGSVYIFTDASAVGTCSGGGSALATCRWSGSAWSAVGGGGGGTAGGYARQVQVNSSGSFAGQSSIFSGGARVQRAVECASGTVSYTALTAAAANQEITIKTGTSGNVRWDQVTVSETDAIHRDVHGSDRFHGPSGIQQLRDDGNAGSAPGVERRLELLDGPANSAATQRHQIGRASCRERA